MNNHMDRWIDQFSDNESEELGQTVQVLINSLRPLYTAAAPPLHLLNSSLKPGSFTQVVFASFAGRKLSFIETKSSVQTNRVLRFGYYLFNFTVRLTLSLI